MKALPRFRDRSKAGQLLARRLATDANRSDGIVLALPRGGVPVDAEIAHALHIPLDVLVVRKRGVPGHEALAMRAIAAAGVRVIYDVVRQRGIPDAAVEQVARLEQRERERRERAYRADRPALDLRDRIVIVVDDGLATGTTMRAALHLVRRYASARIILAIPTASPATCRAFMTEADEVICLMTPEPFHGVGRWYDDVHQISAAQVRDLVERAAQHVEATQQEGPG
jgi:predicted phosphoribosyltransferase